MGKTPEDLEKYVVGFNFKDKNKPFVLIAEHNGKVVVPVNLIEDKAGVNELYRLLTRKEPV
jgi:hypothetical protein